MTFVDEALAAFLGNDRIRAYGSKRPILLAVEPRHR
jgi:hypothetical protein